MSSTVGVRVEQARMIVQRLERLSADSRWSHLASGYRGSLIKILERLERLPDMEQAIQDEQAQLDFLIDQGFDLLTKAAREIGDPELVHFVSQFSPEKRR